MHDHPAIGIDQVAEFARILPAGLPHERWNRGHKSAFSRTYDLVPHMTIALRIKLTYSLLMQVEFDDTSRRSTSSLPAALHPASRRRSYFQLQGLGLPWHRLSLCKYGAFTGARHPVLRTGATVAHSFAAFASGLSRCACQIAVYKRSKRSGRNCQDRKPEPARAKGGGI